MLERRWIDAQPSFAEAHFLNGFPHKDGRFHFAPDWAALGPRPRGACRACPTIWRTPTKPRPDRPFRMVTAPSRQFLNTSFTEMPSSRRSEGGRPTVLVHPADAVRLGVVDGGKVRLGNARGEVVLHAASPRACSPA